MSSNKEKDKSKSSKPKVRSEHVMARNMAAYSLLRRASVVALIALLCTIISIAATLKIFSSTPPPRYIQLTEDARVFTPLPTTTPNADTAEIVMFSIDAIKGIHTYDYINWKDQFTQQGHKFTAKGWRSYMDELYKAKTLVLVEEKRMISSAKPTGKAFIEQEGKENGVGSYLWVVKAPFEITFTPGDTSASSITQSGIITLYVKRVPQEVSTRGYAIEVYQFAITGQ